MRPPAVLPPTISWIWSGKKSASSFQSALRSARSSTKQATRRKISVKTNGDSQVINLHVCPQLFPKELTGSFLVVFEDIDLTPMVSDTKPGSRKESLKKSSRIAELERELQDNRESHQTTIEEFESTNEELKSTNEELQSTNEELQSTNEELESSREELQSLNEELQTLNAELQSKMDELGATNDDMYNLLNSTEIATIFVNSDHTYSTFHPGGDGHYQPYRDRHRATSTARSDQSFL